MIHPRNVMLQVPDFGQRIFTYQVVEHRSDSVGQIAKQYDPKPGNIYPDALGISQKTGLRGNSRILHGGVIELNLYHQMTQTIQ